MSKEYISKDELINVIENFKGCEVNYDLINEIKALPTFDLQSTEELIQKIKHYNQSIFDCKYECDKVLIFSEKIKQLIQVYEKQIMFEGKNNG